MAISADEIRSRLAKFAARWADYSRSERAEAQTFLNELFECYGQNRVDCGATFEEPQEGRFLDLIYPGRLHRLLDEAVASAYGWQKSIAQDRLATNARLLELNFAIAGGEIGYSPFVPSAEIAR